MKYAQTRQVMAIAPVIPVVVVSDAASAVEIARALVAGGIRVIEVTLRTEAGLAAIEAIAQQVDDICVGAGTVWTEAQAEQAIDAGAEFMVSPGIADDVNAVAQARDIAYLPGAQTVSEIAHLKRQGVTATKLFPASVVGGPAAIKAFASVFPDLVFCPTGGIKEDTARDYLALDCVPCVGGSWLVSADAVAGGDWEAVRLAAERAVALSDS
ncbi:4-hydroxy-2-oxoglutarate aldolase protein [Salinisphaera shabanensis E1L3A]|uniref:2-dehydro-3-deoxy-phosphogluconate aldolase n=1 Tax=Salinisphaera shabanensis E1L3A TaxID=1033802 RepID=F7Q3T5_9GAMM|nr:bifunctional 4-hydroxy-2-oxoglutarate aldolase/2-dehydro-3-deoxy-phosphogluconate aldolase [Salinisphaera shabanensis]ERJ18375.1 4-hydroxy-2-oxoglutarate aldolase protein [Salinisphaera shabanensis E1L3A]